MKSRNDCTDLKIFVDAFQHLLDLMNPVIASIRLAEDELFNSQEDARDSLVIANESAIETFKSMYAFLEIAKMASGASYVEHETVNLAVAMQDLISDYRLAAENKNLWLKCCTIPSITVQSNPQKLIDVLGYLISDAIFFTPTGGVTIECRTQKSIGDNQNRISMPKQISVTEEHQWVVISFTDTGCYLPVEDKDDAFGSILRSSWTRIRHCKERRRNLLLCHYLLKDMGGRICLHSEREKGSIIEVALPISDPV